MKKIVFSLMVGIFILSGCGGNKLTPKKHSNSVSIGKYTDTPLLYIYLTKDGKIETITESLEKDNKNEYIIFSRNGFAPSYNPNPNFSICGNKKHNDFHKVNKFCNSFFTEKEEIITAIGRSLNTVLSLGSNIRNNNIKSAKEFNEQKFKNFVYKLDKNPQIIKASKNLEKLNIGYKFINENNLIWSKHYYDSLFVKQYKKENKENKISFKSYFEKNKSNLIVYDFRTAKIFNFNALSSNLFKTSGGNSFDMYCKIRKLNPNKSEKELFSSLVPKPTIKLGTQSREKTIAKKRENSYSYFVKKFSKKEVLNEFGEITKIDTCLVYDELKKRSLKTNLKTETLKLINEAIEREFRLGVRGFDSRHGSMGTRVSCIEKFTPMYINKGLLPSEISFNDASFQTKKSAIKINANIYTLLNLVNNYTTGSSLSKLSKKRLSLFYSFLAKQGVSFQLPIDERHCNFSFEIFMDPTVEYVKALKSGNKNAIKLYALLQTKDNLKIGQFLLKHK